MSNLMRSAAGSFEGITEKMNSSKFIKSAKILNESFKNMISAIPGIGALSGLLMQFMDATGILRPFQAVFQVLLGLFGIMGAQVIPVLMEAIRPLIATMMEMIPLWIFAGQVLAIVIQIGLIPFIITLEIFREVMLPLIPIFEELNPILIELHPLISELTEVLKLIVPPIVMLIQIFLNLDGIIGTTMARIDVFGMVVSNLGSVIGVAESAISGFVGQIQALISAANSFTFGGFGGGGGGGGGDDDDDDDWWPFW